MTEFSGLTRRDFMLQTAVLAGSMLVSRTRPLGAQTEQATSGSLSIWYRRPAAQWVEALPIGNGRLGAMASSRPGGQPANLQGIWNEQMRPPWSSNFTINISTQMNYWPAETTNLAELHEPLIDFVEHLAANGRTTAQVNYGAREWVAHHSSDIWAQSAPVGAYGKGDPVWANWHGASAWLSRHLWDHFAFSGNKRFLRDRTYPVMKAAAEFYLDFLVPDGNGNLVTSPSARHGSHVSEHRLSAGEPTVIRTGGAP
jgi:alpha-L-fucosidase 2